MSLRGRGLSGPSGNLSRERLVQDATVFIDGIGEPVGVVGLSSGALLSPAARSDPLRSGRCEGAFASRVALDRTP
jgi:hypothetical protein